MFSFFKLFKFFKLLSRRDKQAPDKSVAAKEAKDSEELQETQDLNAHNDQHKEYDQNEQKIEKAPETQKIKKARSNHAVTGSTKDEAFASLQKNTSGQNRLFTFLLLVGVGGGLLWLFIVFLSPKSKVASDDSPTRAAGEFVKVKGATFTADDNKSALTHQQRQIDEVISQLNKLKTDNQSLSDTLRTQRKNFEKENAALKKALEAQKQQMQQNQETQQWVEGVKRPLRGLSGSHKVGANGENETKPKDANRSQLPHGQSLSDLNYPDYHDNLNHGDIFSRGESVSHEQTEATPVVRLPVSFSKTVVEKEPISKYIRTHKNYVPTGTFCEAILLGAAEAQAGVDAQGDASPIMFEVKNNCFLPNGKRSYLKGAFITASVYGRISSSRGMVRLEHLSLVRKDGSILDIGVEGTAFDLSGKNGIRGEFKLRNDKVIMNAGIAGLLSGLGESASQYSQTQSISPLGATSTIDASKILPNALGKGASQSFGEISKYYIEFAKQFQPTIDLRAGAKVNIVFLKGFPILDEARIRAYEQKVDAAREERMKQANMQNTQNMQVPTSPYLAQAPMTGADEYGSGSADNAQINPFSGDMLTQAGQARQVEAPLADGLV